MYTLLLRLAGPLQSWGSDSKFEIRHTELYPTKSGVVGMVAAALGRRRNESIKDLADLKYGVRVDQEGTVIEDFHTAQKDEKTSYVTRRYYLSDAVFVVGISSDNKEELENISDALQHPVYSVFLGRRSCVPSPGMVLGIVQEDLLQALSGYPWQGTSRKKPEKLSLYVSGKDGSSYTRINDEPVSFDPRRRKFNARIVSRYDVPTIISNTQQACEEHDPFVGLEDYKG